MRLKKENVIAYQIPIREKGIRRLIANQIAIRVAQSEYDRPTKAFAKDVESELYIMDPLEQMRSLSMPMSSPSNGVPMMKNELNSGKTVGNPATNNSKNKRSHADMQLGNGESGEDSEHDRHTKAFIKEADSLDIPDWVDWRNLVDFANTDDIVESGVSLDIDGNFDGIDLLSNGYSPSETNEDKIEMEEEGGATGVGLAEDKAAAGKPDATECSNVTSEDGNGEGLVGDKSDDTSSFFDIRQPVGKHDPIPSTSSNYDMETEGIGVTSVDRNGEGLVGDKSDDTSSLLDKRQPVGKHDPIPSTSSNYDMETEGIGVTSVDRNVTAQKQTPRFEWTNKGTEQLIALFKNNIPRMTENPNEKRQVWEDIATDLQEIMPGVTSKQVRIKWKNLKDLPKKLDDGKVKKEPPYYDLLCSVVNLRIVNPLPSLTAGPSTETIDRSLERIPGGQISILADHSHSNYSCFGGLIFYHIFKQSQSTALAVHLHLSRQSLNYDEFLKGITAADIMVDNLFESSKTYQQNMYDRHTQLVEAKKEKTKTFLNSLQDDIDNSNIAALLYQKDYDMSHECITELKTKLTHDWYKAAAEESNDLVEYIKVKKEIHKVESFMDTFVSKLNSNLGENTFKMQPERIEKLLNTFTSKVESLVKLEETFQRKESDLHQTTIRQNKEYILTLKGYAQELNRLGVVKETFQCKCVNQQVLKPLTTRACAV